MNAWVNRAIFYNEIEQMRTNKSPITHPKEKIPNLTKRIYFPST